MRVLLVYAPYLRMYSQNSFMFPLGLGYLAAALKLHHDVATHYFDDFKTACKTLPAICAKFRPDVVGLTCNTFNRGGVKRMIPLIRALRKEAKIVLGGVHASFCYAHMLEDYGADIVVLGEGEKTIVDLCRVLSKKQSLGDVKGIAYREGGRIIVTPAQEHILDLDELTMPDYSYAQQFMEQSKMGFLITSRGCPVRCHFCSSSSYWGQKVRMNSPLRVVDEMEMLVDRFGVEKIFFHDDTFNLGIERVKAICDEILKRKLRIKWGCSCRVVPVTEEMLSAMVNAGCRHVGWGIESGSSEMLQRIGKKISLEQIRKAFDLSGKFSNRITTRAYMMVGNPGESESTIRQTFDFLRTLPMNDFAGVAMLSVLPGTILYDTLLAKKQIAESQWSEYDSVPYYTLEHSLFKLHRWVQMLSRYNNTLAPPIEGRFWDGVQGTKNNRNVRVMCGLTLHTIGTLLWPLSSAFSTIRKLLPGGRIRF